MDSQPGLNSLRSVSNLIDPQSNFSEMERSSIYESIYYNILSIVVYQYT